MKVLRLAVHNVAGVKDIDWDLSGHHLFIVGGRNGHGKSSAVKSLRMALEGRSGMGKEFPPVPLRKDEDEGWINLALSGDESLHEDAGFVARVRLSRRRDGSIKEELVLMDSAGEPAAEPRATLQRLFSARCLDPTAFDRLPPKEQRATLQKLFPELDFTEKDKDRKRLYEERTGVNSQGKALAARVGAMTQHKDTPEKEVSVAELMATKKAREDTNKANDAERQKFTDLERVANGFKADVAEAELRVEQLKRELAAAEQDVIRIAAQKKLADSEVAKQAAVVEKLEDQDTADIERQIIESEATNRKVRENAQRVVANAELVELRKESKRLGDEIAAIDAGKARILREADLPVAGLGLDSEGVTFNDLPFEQANDATRFIVGAKIAMALKPTLKLLVCEHGSGLDWQTLAGFEEMLKEHDYQAIVEVCSKSESDDERCQVVMYDGTDQKPDREDVTVTGEDIGEVK